LSSDPADWAAGRVEVSKVEVAVDDGAGADRQLRTARGKAAISPWTRTRSGRRAWLLSGA
jgi:hypothetical protein